MMFNNGPRTTDHGRRSAFTLVELLVVIGIILLVSATMVGVHLRTSDQQKARDGADRLQGWLLIAKSWALRDHAPRGVRLIVNGGLVTQLQYIEQPEEWTWPGGTLTYTVGNPTVTVTTSQPGLDLRDIARCPYPTYANADALEMDSGANAQVAVITGAGANTLSLNSPLPTSPFTGTNWRVLRAPQPRTGEAPLVMPYKGEVAIDLNTNTTYGRAPALAPQVDILFAPSGAVIGPFPTDLKLWVRDMTKYPAGEQFIVSISIRTGLIAVHPVDVTSGNPYSYTQDGRSSGL